MSNEVKVQEIEEKKETKKTVAEKKSPSTKKAGTAKKADAVEAAVPIIKPEETPAPDSIEKVTGDVIDTRLFPAEECKQFHMQCENIDKNIMQVNTSFLKIAVSVYTIHAHEWYKIENFPNIYAFVQEKYGLGRATCSNYINICKKFGKLENDGKDCKGLLPEYEKYSSSQLVEMLKVPKQYLSEFKPEMSVRDMKRKRGICEEQKSLQGTASESDTEEPVKKSVKTKKLWKTQDVNTLLKLENPDVTSKLEEFEEKHPGAKFNISITLEYEE